MRGSLNVDQLRPRINGAPSSHIETDCSKVFSPYSSLNGSCRPAAHGHTSAQAAAGNLHIKDNILTNEELVYLIQSGREDLILTLWDQVRPFIGVLASAYLQSLESPGVVDEEDLVQSGYIAFANSVRSYEADRGASFATYLSMRLKTAFREASLMRTPKQQHDPIHYAKSIYAPTGGDCDGRLLDMLPDNDGTSIEEIEAAIWREELADTLQKALDGLPEREATAIRGKYLSGQTYAHMAKTEGTTPHMIKRWAEQGLERLKKEAPQNHLEEFVSRKKDDTLEEKTPYYMRTRYNNTGYSPVEKIAELREIWRDQARREAIQAGISQIL